MEFVSLKAEVREETGKGAGRKMRAENKIAGVVYGRKVESRKVAVDVKALEDAMKASETLEVFVNLEVAGDTYPAILKELQVDAVSGEYLHADFYTVEMERKIDVRVPVVTVGVSKGVDMGGKLQHVCREISIRCLPASVPAAIEVDVTELGMGESVQVADLVLPEGATALFDPTNTVVTVLLPKGVSLKDEEEGSEAE